jgi:predicted PurR-regulated permease PerM
MLGSTILETAIGIIFIYLLISLVCSIINEWIVRLFSIRSNTLGKWIKDFFENEELIEKFYQNPLIKSLKESPKRLPSYIPSEVFSKALLDTVVKYVPKKDMKTDINSLIEKANIPSDNLKQILSSLVDRASDSIEKTITNISSYFNNAMDRVSGWYKRKINIIIFFISLLICTVLNIDTITLIKEISVNSELRAVLTANAEDYINQKTDGKQETIK